MSSLEIYAYGIAILGTIVGIAGFILLRFRYE